MDTKTIIKIISASRTKEYYITQRKDFKIETILDSADASVTFSVPDQVYPITCESYVVVEHQEYIVKEISPVKNGYRDVKAILNLEDLEGKLFSTYEKKATAKVHLEEALKDTGWTIQYQLDDNTELTIEDENTTAKAIIDQVREIFGLEVRYNTQSKVLYAARQIGDDEGVVFLKGVNLLKTEIKRDTYNYCTRLYPIGKDGLTIESVNSGKKYIDAAGAEKVVAQYWEDTAYETAEGLLTAARYKLAEMAQTAVTVTVKIVDLAGKNKNKYAMYAFEVGDTVSVVDVKENGKYRVTKKTIYPDQQHKNTVQLSNRNKSFADYAKQLKAKSYETDKIIIKFNRNLENVQAEIKDMKENPQKNVEGNAGTSTKLQTGRRIEGMLFDGTKDISHYATCYTSASTAAKTAGLSGFSLVTGARVCVCFNYGNTAANPTLNVNNTGAKAIYYKNRNIPAELIASYTVLELVYTGSYWYVIGVIDRATALSTTAVTPSATGSWYYSSAISSLANYDEIRVWLEIADGEKGWITLTRKDAAETVHTLYLTASYNARVQLKWDTTNNKVGVYVRNIGSGWTANKVSVKRIEGVR